MLLDQLRDLGPRLEAAKGGADPLAARDELKRPRGNFLPRSGDADDAGRAPAAVRALERRAHDLDVAGAVEGIIAAPLRHLDDALLDGRRRVHRVQAVGGAQRPRDFELVRIDVDNNNPRGADLFRGLDHRQAHRPEAEDGHRRPKSDLGRVQHRAQTRRDAAAEEARLVQRHRRRDFGARDFGEDGVLAERRATHEVPNRSPVLERKPRRAVGHHARALRAADLRAQVRLGRRAEDARRRAALGRVARHDAVADFQRRNARPHRLDDGAGLVPEDARELSFCVLPGPRVDVRVAERVGDDFHADLAKVRRRDDDVDALQRRLWGEGHHGLARSRLRPSRDHRHQRRRQRRRLGRGDGSLPSRSLLKFVDGARPQSRCVEGDVVGDKSRDEKVRVVVPRLQAQPESLFLLGAHAFELCNRKLVYGADHKVVRTPDIDEEFKVKGPLGPH
mmetsp:Transcript_18242/g.61524  ORF Transcript_18242/g.61524 Transcript_18242/m.61524 type:complete len:449 (+) Transcript_18242:303-1649(+)